MYIRNLLLLLHPLAESTPVALSTCRLTPVTISFPRVSIMREDTIRVIDTTRRYRQTSANVIKTTSLATTSPKDPSAQSCSRTCARCCSSRQILQRTRVLLQHQALSPVLDALPPLLDLHTYDSHQSPSQKIRSLSREGERERGYPGLG